MEDGVKIVVVALFANLTLAIATFVASRRRCSPTLSTPRR